MESNSRRRILRIVCILLLIMSGLTAMEPTLWGQPVLSGKPLLQNIQAQRQDDYVSIVLTFKGKPFVEEPIVMKDSVKLFCRDTTTKLSQRQTYSTVKSWATLRQADNGLDVELGIPSDRPVVRFSPITGTGQMVVSFYKSGEGLPVTEAKSANQSADIITLNFYENDIRQVLLGLGVSRNVNVVMSPEVTGKVTVHLDKVTFDEAVSSIALAGGFYHRKEKGVYFVYKPTVKADPQADRLEVRVFKLKFAKTDKIQEILSAIPGIRVVRIHEDTKSVVVEDTPENLAKIEKIIKAWEESPRQVLIEATILEVSLTDDMKLGVDWRAIMGTTSIDTAGNFGAAASKGVTGTIQSAVGTMHEFTGAIKALQSITKVNTLSTPKILTVHGKPARVQVGGKQGYKTTVTNLGVTTEQIQFLDTGTILDITAFISDENNILLTVQPQSNSVTIDSQTQIPTVSTTTVSTTLLARSNQTVFIGGLIQDSVTNTRSIIPFLGKIPFLGVLFGYTNPNVQKKELVVLITPQIMEPEINRATAEAEQKVDGVSKRYQEGFPSVYKEMFKN